MKCTSQYSFISQVTAGIKIALHMCLHAIRVNSQRYLITYFSTVSHKSKCGVQNTAMPWWDIWPSNLETWNCDQRNKSWVSSTLPEKGTSCNQECWLWVRIEILKILCYTLGPNRRGLQCCSYDCFKKCLGLNDYGSFVQCLSDWPRNTALTHIWWKLVICVGYFLLILNAIWTNFKNRVGKFKTTSGSVCPTV